MRGRSKRQSENFNRRLDFFFSQLEREKDKKIQHQVEELTFTALKNKSMPVLRLRK